LIVATVAAAIGVLRILYLGFRKNLQVGESTKMGLNLSSDLKCPTCNVQRTSGK
jgi:hypothetical protein